MITETSPHEPTHTSRQPTSPPPGAAPRPPTRAATRPPAGPPPPPAARGGTGESRVTAATWLAALGAVLLLSAAGTFLAVRWEVMPLVARVAVVAAITGAAIFGGHRLRRVLPAVGAVVFHLGALLVPVDALGLALQLGVGVPGRWLAVGLTGVVVLPLLALAGRSSVLAWAGVASVPVAATGFGLLGVIAAPILVAGAGLVLTGLVAADPDRTGRLPAPLRAAGPALAATAIVAGLALAVVDQLTGSGGLLDGIRSAGWITTELSAVLIVGALATAACVLATLTTRSRVAAMGVVGVLGATLVQALLVAGSPRLALFVGVPGLLVLLEGGVIAAERDEALGRIAARVAATGEVLLAPGILTAVALLVFVQDLAADPGELFDRVELGRGAMLMAVAWGLAAVRRRGRIGAVAVLAVAAGVVHLAVGFVLVGAPAAGATMVLLSAVALGLAAASRSSRGWTQRPAAVVVTWACTQVGLVILATLGSSVAARNPVGALALGLLAAQVLLVARAAPSVARPLRWSTLLSGLALAIGLAVTSPLPPAGGVGVGIALIVILGTAGLALAAAPEVGAADTAWGVVAGFGLLLVVPAWSVPLGSELPAGTAALVLAAGLDPAALLPAAVAATLLIAATALTGRVRLALFAVPVVVRTAVAAAFGLGATAVQVGVGLVCAAVLATGLLVVVPRAWRAVPIAFAVVAGGLGWVLAGDVELLRATSLIGIGVALVVAGIVKRQAVVAHLGGFVVTLGVWDAFGVVGVESLDLWVLPLAVHLFVAADAARRAGTATSSWFVDVPPVVLVGGAAMLERLATGVGWHALLAGVVAVAAVVHGAVGRHAGPLVVGTLLLLAVVGVEVFATVAAVPTWAWLTVGGLVLFGAAALVERAEGTPMRAARRLLDVVGERFD